jgi:hypothetical protein
MSLHITTKKLKILFSLFLVFFIASHLLYGKNSEKIQTKKVLKNKKQEASEAPQTEKPKKDIETDEGGVSYYEKSKRKAKEPHKNTKARGPMDPSNRQGEGLQNVNGSRE